MKVTLGPGLDQVQTGLKPGFVKPGLNPVHKSCEIQNKTWSKPGLDQVYQTRFKPGLDQGLNPLAKLALYVCTKGAGLRNKDILYVVSSISICKNVR